MAAHTTCATTTRQSLGPTTYTHAFNEGRTVELGTGIARALAAATTRPR
ncbi:hypothetical protein ACTWJ8_36680 [Streptomyces sp. SDT5-1]